MILDKKNDTIALIGTLAFHSILLLIALKYVIPSPKSTELSKFEYFELNMPETTKEPAPSAVPSSKESIKKNEGNSTKKSLIQNSNQRLAIPKATAAYKIEPKGTVSSRNHNTPITHPQQNATPTQQPKGVYTGRNHAGGSGQGNGSHVNTSSSHGGGSGGFGYSLGDRKLVNRPGLYGNNSSSGIVKIRIVVDRNGKIKRHSIISASSSDLKSLAISKLDDIRFNTDNNAPVEQSGVVTFKFLK